MPYKGCYPKVTKTLSKINKTQKINVKMYFIGIDLAWSKKNGSGVVILRYLNTFSISVGAGLSWSGTEGTDGSYKYATITAGTGTVSFA